MESLAAVLYRKAMKTGHLEPLAKTGRSAGLVACFQYPTHDARRVFGKDLTRLMCCSRALALVTLMLLVVSLSACAGQPPTSPRDEADANDTGRRLAPSGEGERALLGRLSKLPSDAPQRVGDATILAEPPYQAASGQTCRALHVTQGKAVARHRLACSDGVTWFFVPDVFGSNAAE
jgi:hypothetical protein